MIIVLNLRLYDVYYYLLFRFMLLIAAYKRFKYIGKQSKTLSYVVVGGWGMLPSP